MKTPTPKLHRFGNHSKQPAKVSVAIAPGDTLDVSDDLAAQLQAASTAIREGQPTMPSEDEIEAANTPVVEEPPDEKPTPARKTVATRGIAKK